MDVKQFKSFCRTAAFNTFYFEVSKALKESEIEVPTIIGERLISDPKNTKGLKYILSYKTSEGTVFVQKYLLADNARVYGAIVEASTDYKEFIKDLESQDLGVNPGSYSLQPQNWGIKSKEGKLKELWFQQFKD